MLQMLDMVVYGFEYWNKNEIGFENYMFYFICT
jgi:hypothetical protein